jgi:hypothetical protein
LGLTSPGFTAIFLLPVPFAAGIADRRRKLAVWRPVSPAIVGDALAVIAMGLAVVAANANSLVFMWILKRIGPILIDSGKK